MNHLVSRNAPRYTVYHIGMAEVPVCGARGEFVVRSKHALRDLVLCGRCAIPHNNALNPVQFDRLSDLVIRPGIEEKLIPLALYRGNLSLADVQKRWNMFLAMYAAEAKTLGAREAFWTARREHSALCFPNTVMPPELQVMQSFASRLRLNPKVTDNVPGFTEYMEYICPRPWDLHAIPLEYTYGNGVPWRIYKPKKKAPRKWKSRPQTAADLCYPYLINKPNAAGENEGLSLVMKIDRAVPKSLPEQIRADICQDLAVAVLCGDVNEGSLEEGSKECVSRMFKMFPAKWGHLSLDQPVPWGDSKTLLRDLI
jgi:hypothetical protein